MAASLLNRVTAVLARLEQALLLTWARRFPPDGLCMAAIDFNHQNHEETKNTRSLSDILNDAFLWAVPRSRRTIEKRWKRKFGSPDLVHKILLPKSNIRTCNSCGDDHEVGVLCPTCYKKVMDETKAMQEKIEETLGLEAVEQEVVVVYEGEKNEKPSEFWNGKRIVEMQKSRPNWFSKNLLQQSTQKPAETTDVVKPSELG